MAHCRGLRIHGAHHLLRELQGDTAVECSCCLHSSTTCTEKLACAFISRARAIAWADQDFLCASSQACSTKVLAMLCSLLQPRGPAPSFPDRCSCCPQMHPLAHVTNPSSPSMQPRQLLWGLAASSNHILSARIRLPRHAPAGLHLVPCSVYHRATLQLVSEYTSVPVSGQLT